VLNCNEIKLIDNTLKLNECMGLNKDLISVEFSNKNRVKPIGLILSFLLMLAVAGLASFYLWFSHFNKSIEVSLWLYFIFISTFFYFGGFYYIEMDLNSSRIDIKYYNLFPLWRQYKRIILPVEKIKYLKVRFGLGFVGAGLVICGRIKGRLATYPTVGLSACSRSQIRELKQYAAQFQKK